MKMTQRTKHLGAYALTLAFLLSRPAVAGNLEKFSLGEDAGLSAGAVVATSADPGSIYYNPAGLASLTRSSVDLGVSAYAARYYRVPRLVQISLPDRQTSMDFEGTSFFSTPSAVIFGGEWGPGSGWALAFLTRDQLDLAGRISQTFQGFNGAQPYEYEQGMAIDFRFQNYLAGLGMGTTLGGARVGLSLFGEYAHQSVGTHFWGDYKDPSTYNPSTSLYGTRLTTSFQQSLAVGSYGARAVLGMQRKLGPWVLGLVARSPRFSVYTDVDIDILLDGSFVPANAVVRYHGNGNGTLHSYQWEEPWRLETALALEGERGSLSIQADASDRPDDEGRGSVWNFKVGGLLHLDPRWDLGLGAYTDRRWDEPTLDFASTNMDYYGVNGGLRWKRWIGGAQGQAGPVELRTSLMLHYERGYGLLRGAKVDALNPNFPLASAETSAVFEEAVLNLSSGLAW